MISCMVDKAELADYRPLDATALGAVLAAVPAIAGRLGGGADGWSIDPLTGGNLNQIFVVRGPDGAVCTKQSLPYMRLLGEAAPMPLDRIMFEQRTLAEHGRHLPDRVPEIYHFDRGLCLVVMEHLAPHVELRQALMEGRQPPRVAAHLGDYMARILFQTSDLALPAAARRDAAAAMAGNAGMHKFIEDLGFVEPYMVHPRNAWNAPYLDAVAAQIRDDVALKTAIGRLKRRYMTANEVWLHGDLHTGSILVTDDDTRIIDFELSAYGPVGYDLGVLYAHILLNFFGQDGFDRPDGEREAGQAWAMTLMEGVWAQLVMTLTELWRTARTGDGYPADWFDGENGAAAEQAALDALLADVLADALGFAGAEMVRRILNLGQVPDLELIADPARRADCERRAVLFARDLIVDAARWGEISAVTKGAAAARAGTG